jgi:hypothetical protein
MLIRISAKWIKTLHNFPLFIFINLKKIYFKIKGINYFALGKQGMTVGQLLYRIHLFLFNNLSNTTINKIG